MCNPVRFSVSMAMWTLVVFDLVASCGMSCAHDGRLYIIRCARRCVGSKNFGIGSHKMLPHFYSHHSILGHNITDHHSIIGRNPSPMIKSRTSLNEFPSTLTTLCKIVLGRVSANNNHYALQMNHNIHGQ